MDEDIQKQPVNHVLKAFFFLAFRGLPSGIWEGAACPLPLSLISAVHQLSWHWRTVHPAAARLARGVAIVQ